MGTVCLRFDSEKLQPADIGWKAYNLTRMWKSNLFSVPVGFVLSVDVFNERVKQLMIDTLIGVIRSKMENDKLFARIIEEEVKISRREINKILTEKDMEDVFVLLFLLDHVARPVYTSSQILSQATSELRRKLNSDINTWTSILECIRTEAKKLSSQVLYVRSSSNFEDDVLAKIPGAFESIPIPSSSIESNKRLFDVIVRVYISALGGRATPNLFIENSFVDFGMGILFQEKEDPLRSGITSCEVKSKNADNFVIKLQVQEYEGEGVAHTRVDLREDAVFRCYAHLYDCCVECREQSDDQELIFARIISEDLISGEGNGKIVYDHEKDDFTLVPASGDNDSLVINSPEKIRELVLQAFNFWRADKQSLLKQKVEFVLSKEGTIKIVQCDNQELAA